VRASRCPPGARSGLSSPRSSGTARGTPGSEQTEREAGESDAGEIKIISQSTGTRGQDDLRPPSPEGIIRRGLHPEVASAGVRMLEAHGAADPIAMEAMRRVIDLDRGLELGL